MWGQQPWDNDSAADWFGKLMDQTNLPALVRKTLLQAKEGNSDLDNNAELRAAAYCVLQFGRTYVWPINDLDNDLQLAIDALEQVRQDDEYCYSEAITNQINSEIEELKDRLKIKAK